MKVTVLSTDRSHPVVPHLKAWVDRTATQGHIAELVYDKSQLTFGDILFLVSCGQFISAAERASYKSTLVLHASDLPRGRGWSPHIWAILDGASEITVSLLEANDRIDTGAVWLRRHFTLQGHELLLEINSLLFDAELALMDSAIERYGAIQPMSQGENSDPPLRKRTAEDSRLDPHKTLAEQFDLLRVVDGQRYPAFFEFRGRRYVVRIEKDENRG